MKRANSFSIVVLVLFIVISIIEIVSSVQAMNELKPILNGNAYYYTSAAITLARATNSVLIVSIIGVSIVLLCSLIFIYSFANESEGSCFAFPTILTAYCVSTLVGIIIITSTAKSLNSAYTMPAESIISLIFVIISLLLSLVSYGFNFSSFNQKYSCVVSGFGYLFYLIAVIVSFAVSSSTTKSTMQILDFVLTIFAVIGVIVACYLLYGDDEIVLTKAQTNYYKNLASITNKTSTSTLNDANPSNSNKKETPTNGSENVEEKLLKLKELYDKDILTKEEYEERRKKLIEKL